MKRELHARRAAEPAYARAGVDVALGDRLKKGIHGKARATHGPEVLGKIGGFGGLFRPDFSGMKEPVLVSSADGVGTKLKIAFASGRHDSVARDLVNHCVNDIAVLGARPLFFLDYIGAGVLEAAVFKQLLSGFARGCKEAGCALIGGETAQMPGMYRRGEYDLAGVIVGVVERRKILDGSAIRPGDVIVGLPSNGLHTNGYSLARQILFKKMRLNLASRPYGIPLGAELLKVHRNYQPRLASLPAGILKGAAHITGGGLEGNLPRILPPDCDAVIDTGRWKIPRLFLLLERGGKISRKEMFEVFNMGMGMALVAAPGRISELIQLTGGKEIGNIISGGSGKVRLRF